MMNMSSVEQPESMGKPPLGRLKSIETKLKGFVAEHNPDVENLSFQSVLNQLKFGLEKGETWPIDHVLFLEQAVDGLRATGEARMEAARNLREKISELSDIGWRGKRAA